LLAHQLAADGRFGMLVGVVICWQNIHVAASTTSHFVEHPVDVLGLGPVTGECVGRTFPADSLAVIHYSSH